MAFSGNSVSITKKRENSDMDFNSERKRKKLGQSKTDTDKKNVREEIREVLESEIVGGSTAISKVANYIPTMPQLYIEEFGFVPLPVNDLIADALRPHFERAPYGLGEDTILDESVRRTWQLGPEKFKIENKDFLSAINNAVLREVKEALGCVNTKVWAEVYKLLLYETGGHFKPHRDTEKADGMFATLIVQLPSQFTGGNLVVSHNGKTKVLEFAHTKASTTCIYAAHYSDVEHEITEVTSGYRLAIVFSLCWNGNGIIPSATKLTGQASLLTSLLEQLSLSSRPDMKIAWALDHMYSLDSLKSKGILALKGNDKSVAENIRNAIAGMKDDEKFSLYITKIAKFEEQYGECTQEWGHGYRSSDGDCFDYCGDTGESGIELEEFVSVNGHFFKIQNLFLDIEEDILNRDDDDDDDDAWWGDVIEGLGGCSGPSGNEGATCTLWYHRYLLILWKESEFLNVLKNDHKAAIKHVTNSLDNAVGDDVQIRKVQDQAIKLMRLFSAAKAGFFNSHCTHDLIELIERFDDVDMVKSFFSLLGGREYQTSVQRALKSKVSRYLIRSVERYSWLTLKLEIQTFLMLQSPCQIEEFLKLCPNDVPKTEIVNQLGEIHIKKGHKLLEEDLKAMILLMFQYDVCSKHLENLQNLHQIQNLPILANVLNHLFTNIDRKLVKTNVHFKKLEGKFVQLVQQESMRNQLNSDLNISTLTTVFPSMLQDENNDNIMALNKAITDQNPNENLLNKILEKFKKKIPVSIQSLVHCRIRQLESVVAAGCPSFSWRQPNAIVQNHPEVQEFLRGPLQVYTYANFNNIQHARNWVNKHFSLFRDNQKTYSAQACAAGTGRRAHAVITKTKSNYDKQVKGFNGQVAELKRLKLLLESKG